MASRISVTKAASSNSITKLDTGPKRNWDKASTIMTAVPHRPRAATVGRASVISIEISPSSTTSRSFSYDRLTMTSSLASSSESLAIANRPSVSVAPRPFVTPRPAIPKIRVDQYADDESPAKNNPIEAFLARITVAGVEDAVKAESKLERHIWIGVIIAALTAMLFVSYAVFVRYLDHSSVHEDSEVVDHVGPFPNVTLCTPMFADTKGAISKTLSEWSVSDGMKQRMARAKVSLEDVIEFAGNGSAFLVTKMDRKSPLVIISLMLLEEIFRDEAVQQIQKLIQPPCEKILTNCKFQGRSFDCCKAAEYLAIDHGICYQISVNQIKDMWNAAAVSGGDAVDPVDLIHTGLAFDASYETQAVLFEDDVAPEGFTVHIDALPTPLAAPVVIPAGAEAMITLAPPVEINELTGCLRQDQLPKLRWFDHYDPNGNLCLSDVVLNKTVYEIGCTIPMLSYVPKKEDVCDAQRVLILMQLLGGQIEEGTTIQVTKYVNELRDWLRSNYYGNVCPPYCTRWSYPIRSASYGYIQYQNHTIIRNTSMSRFRVFFPSASYRQHSEALVNVGYLIFCEMGGVWGVYLGLSIVSIVQTVVYSLAIARLKAKSGKVKAIG